MPAINWNTSSSLPRAGKYNLEIISATEKMSQAGHPYFGGGR